MNPESFGEDAISGFVLKFVVDFVRRFAAKLDGKLVHLVTALLAGAIVAARQWVATVDPGIGTDWKVLGARWFVTIASAVTTHEVTLGNPVTKALKGE